MLEHIKNILQQHPEQTGDLLHIGAGLCSELEEYQTQGFHQLHLYEGAPAQYKLLQERTQSAPNINTYHQVIAGKQETLPFYIMNNPSFNSLRDQSALTEHFPNLKLIEEPTVETESLTQAIKRAELDGNKTNILVLEVLGAETLLETVSEEQLQAFSWILIKQLNEVTHTATELNSDIFDQAFSEALMFPFILKAYKRNTRVMELNSALEQLRGQLSSKENELTKRVSELEQVKRQLSAKDNEFSKVRDELLKSKQTLKERCETLEVDKKSMSSDLEEKDKVLNKIRDELKKTQQSVKDSSEVLESEKATLAANLKAKGEALNKAQNELEKSQKLLKERAKELEAMSTRFQQTEQTNSLNAKLLVKANADLADLRSNYANKMESEKKLEELIEELYEKLEMAANFYHRLQKTHPDLLDVGD